MCILRLSDYSGSYHWIWWETYAQCVYVCIYWGYLTTGRIADWSPANAWACVRAGGYNYCPPPPPHHPVCQHPQDLSHYSTIFLLSPCSHTILQDIQCTIPRICQPPSSQVILLRIKSINCSVVDPDPKLICWIRLLVWQKIIIKKSQTLVIDYVKK